MKLSFFGRARSVTGSRHMLEVPGFRQLFDCGMFQGRREEAVRRNRDLGFDPKSLGAVLLSHAHIDHSGALPVLARQGFSGKVYLTRASADLACIMLEDSARVQENDCRYVNRQEHRRGETCILPWYDGEDVRKIVRKFEGSRYGDQLKIAPRISASFHDAGHTLGSAWDVVPIFGMPTPRRPQIVKFNGLSAHDDRNDLLAYVRAIDPLPSTIHIVHGEEKQALSLGAAIQAEHPNITVRIPHRGSVHEI